jgi:hypothetical protein
MYKVRLALGVVGLVVVVLGLVACFLFGLLPIVAAMDEDPVGWGCGVAFVVGLLLWVNGIQAGFEEERRRECRTYRYDRELRAWVEER